ncbi:hypothetical protein HOY82DRAFT_624186, partial [Tuber indicum]
MATSDIDILSDYPVRYHETFTLESRGRVKFTTVFKLDHENIDSTQPEYFDISPHLEPFSDRWWGFKTESSSFIFRRNLETILSHVMPLPRIDGEAYQPYVLHDHDLINTFQTWSSSLNQALYLLEIDKILQHQDTADEVTKSYYRKRIRKLIFGYFIWLLRHAERNGFPETVLLHWSGKLAPLTKNDGTKGFRGEEKREKEREVLNRPTEKSFEAGVVEPTRLVATPTAKVCCPMDIKTLPLLCVGGTRGCTSRFKRASTSHPGKIEESVDPPPLSPFEPELSRYEDKFRNCCQFLVLLDMCLANYPDEKALFIRMVEAFLKLAWEPIEMSKHRGSHLWPDRLDILEGFPSPYARFQDWGDVENCGYGGQGTYVYAITTQVLVWRAIKSTNRLLHLVHKDQNWSKWGVHQSLDGEAIRDRTVEVFRRLGTDTSHDCFLDRFFSKIKGHIKESFLDQWSCDIAIPSFVEDFFFDHKNEPMSAWTETLRYCDTFSDSAKAQTPNTWESFMRYQLTIDRDRRHALRESFEAKAYSVGLFTNGAVTHGSHCPYTTSWAMVTYVLSADHTELLYPKNKDHRTRTDRAQGPMLSQEDLMNASINTRTGICSGARQDGRKPGKREKGFDITAEDRRQVNDPPSYGEWYWFREPLFMKHKPKKFEMNREFIETFLQPECNWSCFWETTQGKANFMKHMANMSNYDWGGKKNILIQPYRNGEFDFFYGSGALSRLQEQRNPKDDKKRIIIMEDCMIEHLIALMAITDFQESSHIGEFLSRLRLMDPHEMRFSEQTIMPDNLWITEFNINFITAPYLADVESPPLPNYFSKKRARFQSINDVVPDYVMAEATMGFRIIGDLHDRYWTCYVFYDFGSEELISDSRTEVERRDYGHSSSQRKCLEGFLVRQALDLVLSEAKTVLDIITKSMGGDKKSRALFNPLLTEDDLSGENYFKTMNKNSVFYPWLLEVYGALRDKCIESRNVAEQWISAEKAREYKPRWSEKDQKSFGEEVAKNRADVKARCTKLEKMAKNLQERIDRIKTLKESLSSELALREARTSTQLAHTVNLFAVVTTIYLPLTFSTSIVAIQDFNWPSPAKALIKITLAVTFGTLILLMNLAFLRRNLAALKAWAQSSVRHRMAGTPERKGSSKELIYREKRPAWKFWEDRARGLREAEKRNTLLTDNATHDSESDWWYWYFMAIYITIVVPVQELTFIIRTLRLQKIENAGPLKKFVRLPWAPIWVLQLALVYVIILASYALLFLVRLVHRMAVWLWTGNYIAESKKAAPEEDKSLISEPEGDDKSLRPEPDSTQKDRGLVYWLKKPAMTMQLLIVAEALPSKKKEIDEENQEVPVEDTVEDTVEDKKIHS